MAAPGVARGALGEEVFEAAGASDHVMSLGKAIVCALGNDG